MACHQLVAADLYRSPRSGTAEGTFRDEFNTEHWRSAHGVSFWLRIKGVTSPPRHNGGFIYSVQARDPYAAAIQVTEIIDRLMARHTFANKTRKLTPVGKQWVSGLDTELSIRRPSRGTHILSLETEGQLYHVTQPSNTQRWPPSQSLSL